MINYKELVKKHEDAIRANGSSWGAINAEHAARMDLQNRFKTGLDIAKYNAAIMREDMAAYDNDPEM